MDLKKTKATPANGIAPPSKKRAPPSGTVEASPGLKSTSSAYLRGLEAERIAYRYLKNKYQARLLRHRYRSPWGEVDLLLRLPTGELVMVEVKSLSHSDRMLGRLGDRQRARLQRVFQWLSEKSGPVLFWLVFVAANGEVIVMDDVLG